MALLLLGAIVMIRELRGCAPSELADDLEFEDGVEILRATHRPLGQDDSVQGQRTDFRAADSDRLAGFPTLLEAANALDLPEQVELTEVRGKIEVFEHAAFRLFAGEGQASGSHAVDRVEFLQGLPRPEQVFRGHVAGHVHIEGEERASP